MTIFKRNPIMHFNGSSTFLGDYQITDEALKSYNVSRESFGSTQVHCTEDHSYNVKDYQYDLGDGKVGMHLIPINDYGAIKDAQGKTYWASQLVDDHLRTEMSLAADDPLYAFIYFFHPELNQGSLPQLMQTEKVEMGITHFGAYYGMGVTSNSPPLYHHRQWQVKGEIDTPYGYPANVLMISLENVEQSTLNKNFLLVDKFLNYGVRFPKNYKESKFRQVDINTCLMFYRDWINEEPYLKTDETWFTYCAAHKTIVATVALNLPHNLSSFQEVYGTAQGEQLFTSFCKNYYQLTGYDFLETDQTNFEPLWQKEGLSQQQIKPFTLEEYTAYDTARREGVLSSFDGFKPCLPTQATPWGPQYTADVLFDFVQAYADFLDAGAISGCSVILGFNEVASQRMGISRLEYFINAIPICEKLVMADAMTKVDSGSVSYCEDSQYYQATMKDLYIAYGGKDNQFIESLQSLPELSKFEGKLSSFASHLIAHPSLIPQLLAWWSLSTVRTNWTQLRSGPVCSKEKANTWLQNSIQSDFEASRKVLVTKEDKIQYNVPPAIIHMAEIGMFQSNSKVTLKTLCTVMSHTELEPKPK